MQRILVIGAGLMGTGITQVAVGAGIEVMLYDSDPAMPPDAVRRIDGFLGRSVAKNRMTSSEKESALSHIHPIHDLGAGAGAEFVIEAVPEKLELKKEIFARLDAAFSPDIVLASNTSSLPITEIAATARHSQRVIGMHFFYPPPKMELVEVTPGLQTRGDVIETTMKLAEAMGKKPVKAPDTPGFLVNRLLVPMMNEAIYCVMEGSRPEDVDAAMKLGAGLPMGPIELADFVGLDTLLFTMEGIYEGFNDSKYRPCPLLKQMVQANRLGRKTGRGFYTY